MTKERNTQAKWILVAFLLLCGISAYRQYSIRVFPTDPVRPVVVYFVYLLLLAGWWVSIRNRVVQVNMRAFLLAVHTAILFGITLRFIQDALLYYVSYFETSIIRLSGYLTIVPLILIPLFSLYAALGLGKSKEYRINSKWYYLLIPAGILILLMATNELHHFTVRIMEDETQVFFYHPNWGVTIILAWAIFFEFARIFIIYSRNRHINGNVRLRSLPLIISVFMLVFIVPYFLASFVAKYELIEFMVMLYFLEIMVWESCIIVGLVPVNTHYERVFDRSTIAMQILDEEGHTYLKSARAPELSAYTFFLLITQGAVLIRENKELHIHQITGGYSVWQNDVSQTLLVIDELQKSAEKLEYDGELLRQELELHSEETAVKEKNQIYNQISAEIGDQLILLRSLLGKREGVEDKAALFRKICLIGTYIKRRCNLRLIELSDGKILNKELELNYQELIRYLQEMRVEAQVFWHTDETLVSELAIFALDVFEFLLEYEHFEPHSMNIIFETESSFSIEVCSKKTHAEPPVEQIKGINKEGYSVDCDVFESGYRVSVCMEGA